MGLRLKFRQRRWFKRLLALFIPILIISQNLKSGVISPKNGGSFPHAVQELLENQKELFVLEHRWADRKILARRTDAGNNTVVLSSSRVGYGSGAVLTGDLNIPVLMGLYYDFYSSDTIPEPLADSLLLGREFFNGPWETGTLNDYFNEVSLGMLDVSGTVYGWVPLPGSEDYYTGGVGNWGLDLTESRTDEMISQTVIGVDGYVDFGQYDNDGPDGIPNSGDDDGYVDILIIVSPTRGAECGLFPVHMWSHSGRFSMWNEGAEPLSTNDSAAGGGSILIEDYIIGPTVSCAPDRLIEIGLFCHELGHALGLTDLYDTGYCGVGIGNWGIMGNGAWNIPESPAHPCAWSKQQLGWVNVIDVGWSEQTIRLEPVATSGEVVRLTLPDARFKRRYCLRGQSSYSLLCACDEKEAEARGWPDEVGAGYGNGWTESMTREFNYDNSSPCSLFCTVTADMEEGYDFGYLLLEASGAIDTIASYTGRMAPVTEMVILSDYLPPAPSVFTLCFLFLSDFNNSDEDKGFDSNGCQVFSIDDINVSGGGLDYFCDFESDAGGWRRDTLSSEYFIAAYRDRRGFDKYLPEEGLLIWHAENAIAYSALKNSGGGSNTQARGVVLEEADGDYDLLFDCGIDRNYGDARDPFPGTTGQTSFTSKTTPNSISNGGAISPVNIRAIHFGHGYLEAVFRAGSPEPVISYVTPDTLLKGEIENQVYLDVSGENMLPPIECHLANQTEDVAASAVSWLGEGRIIVEFNPEELYGGYWDLKLKSGDGQLASLTEAVFVNSIYCYAYARVKSCFVDIDWSIKGDMPFRSLVYRMPYGKVDSVMMTPDTLSNTDGVFHFRDTEIDPGQDYSYKILSFSGSVSESILFPGPYRIEKMPLTLFQNYPNPFAAATTLRFYLPLSVKAKILFFDVSGREIKRTAEKFYTAGYNTVKFEVDSELFASGVYFCVLDTRGKREAIKIVILR